MTQKNFGGKLHSALMFRFNKWWWYVENWNPDDPDYDNELEPEHLQMIQDHFGIPSGIIPAIAFQTISGNKLVQLSTFISTVGEDKLRQVFEQLATSGLLVKGYLGGGAWGEVFLLEGLNQPDIPNASIALKILKPPYEAEWKKRYTKESDILQKVSQANGVVKIVQPIEEINGLLCIQTEFVKGNCLADYQLPLEPSAAFSLTRKVLVSLSEVHEVGVIHRDLHVGNIIVQSPENRDERIVVLDFGLARDESGLEYSQTFRPVGAMSHCAPEKWLQPSAAGKASDVFSVGIMLYKLLTNKMPFWSDTFIGLYEKIKLGHFDAASIINPSVPQFMDLVINEMLYSEPDARPQDAGQALQLLDSVKPVMNLWLRQHT